MKTILENWKKFINEQEQPALYTGAVLEKDAIDFLNAKIKELNLNKNNWVQSSKGSHGHEQLNHHMTITPSPADKTPEAKELLGQAVDLKIVGFGVDEKFGIAAWKVETNIPVKSGVPHITALLKDQSVKPFLAAKITNWNDIKPFTISATIQEVFKK